MKIYVGTYAKYNNGSLFGKWLRLEDYLNIKEFYQACKELHKDEDDPEFMFQDWEGIPETEINEGHLEPTLWELFEYSEPEKEIILAFMDATGERLDHALEYALDYYVGHYDSMADYAEDYFSDVESQDVVERWGFYIDYEALGETLRIDGMTFHNGILFSC